MISCLNNAHLQLRLRQRVPISVYTTYIPDRSISSFPDLTVRPIHQSHNQVNSYRIDGRNSSTAFALSSGTIGAALAAALAVPIPGPTSGPSLHTDHIPAIALSYGVIKRPVPAIVSQLAHEASAEVCARLWEDWGYEDGTGKRIQLYTINVPLEEEPLRPENRKVCWTRLWRNAYGALFQATKA